MNESAEGWIQLAVGTFSVPLTDPGIPASEVDQLSQLLLEKSERQEVG